MIAIKDISKTFKIPIREAGMKHAIKAFFKREYRYVKAVDNISLNIQEGEIIGYIGPNGAGKSTTIKILSGILTPDSGFVSINGIDPIKERKKNAQQIGVVFGQRTQLWWDLPVADSYRLIQEIYKIPEIEFNQRLNEFIALFDLKEIIKSPVRQLSLGQRVRCDIVASLLHNPKVLFLDEPTIGLDAHSKRNVRNLVKLINEKYNTTVILTTHDMKDIEELAHRVVLIGEGKILYEDSVGELKTKYESKKRIAIKYKGVLQEDMSYVINEDKDNRAILTLNTDLATVISKLQTSLELLDLETENSSLDEIIIALYEDYGL